MLSVGGGLVVALRWSYFKWVHSKPNTDGLGRWSKVERARF